MCALVSIVFCTVESTVYMLHFVLVRFTVYIKYVLSIEAEDQESEAPSSIEDSDEENGEQEFVPKKNTTKTALETERAKEAYDLRTLPPRDLDEVPAYKEWAFRV